MKEICGGVCASKGFKANGVHCGIRKSKTKKDLALIVCDTICTCASVYTQNKVKGAPILVTKKNIQDGFAQAIICNSGNANTCNFDGEEKAQAMCNLVEKYCGIDSKNVVVASTGVIGQVLALEPIVSGMQQLVDGLAYDKSADAATAIMTTDTQMKEFAVEFVVDKKVCHIGGIAKGSGMIHPNMATLLCFLTTDVAISSSMLDKALHYVVDDTMNMVSIDGDTSTNDMLSILASGLAGNNVINEQNGDYTIFTDALMSILTLISKAVAKDGEGATKLLECHVVKAPSKLVAKKIAKSVVCSSLLKAAIFAADANWGRILCAIGYADAQFDINKIDVDMVSKTGKISVCKNGVGVEFSEEKAKVVLSDNEITVYVMCNDGDGEAKAWGCDLTYDYVKINADYRS